MELHIQLDDEHSGKITHLHQKFNIQFDTLVQQGIDLLYERQNKPSATFEIMQETGFIGCLAGHGALSENYKEEISLDEKL